MKQMRFAEVGRYRVPLDRAYHRVDETWVRDEGDLLRIGVCELAVETFGDLAALTIAPVGSVLRRGDEMGSVEAQKYVGALRAPISGTVVEVNARALSGARVVQEEPYGEGWLALVRPGPGASEELTDLVAADEVPVWFEARLCDYREKGALAE